MAESGMKIDFSDFNKKFEEITKVVIPDLGRKGLFNAGAELLLDSDKIPPKTPKDTGMLRGSKMIAIKYSAKVGSVAGIKKEEDMESLGELMARVGFNIKYAAAVHEMGAPTQLQLVHGWAGKTIHWTEPGSGAKYLQSKMMMLREKYMRIVAETIKAGGTKK